MSSVLTDLDNEELVIAVCRQSVNAFNEVVLGIKQGDVHRSFQSHLGEHLDSYSELHRGNGKTTQLIGRVAWEIGKNPELRIKYVQQSDDESAKTVETLQQIIDSPEYRMIFPEVTPDFKLWGKKAFRVTRKSKKRDATVEAKGIFGRAGGRADLLVGDDICDLRNSIQQPALREQVKEFWNNNWYPMLDRAEGIQPRVWKVGTCYHVSDITADWRAVHGANGSLFRLPVVDFKSPWPEAFDPETLRKIRQEIGPIAYARAYELSPVSSETIVFPAEWLETAFYETMPDWESRNCSSWAMIDWAFTEKKQDNNPDYSICLFGKKSRNGHIFLEDMVRVRKSYPEFRSMVIDKGEFWQVSGMRAEANGPQKALVQDINRYSPFPVSPINRMQDKITRATAAQSFVEAGRLHIRAQKDSSGRLQPIDALKPLYDEMTVFPAGDHDDCVDAAIDFVEFASTSGGRRTHVRRITDKTSAYQKLYG